MILTIHYGTKFNVVDKKTDVICFNTPALISWAVDTMIQVWTPLRSFPFWFIASMNPFLISSNAYYEYIGASLKTLHHTVTHGKSTFIYTITQNACICIPE